MSTDESSEDEQQSSIRYSSPYRSPASSPGPPSSSRDPASSPPYVLHSSPSRDADYSPDHSAQYPKKRKDYEIFEPGVPSSSKCLRREERCGSHDDSSSHDNVDDQNRECVKDDDAIEDNCEMDFQECGEDNVCADTDLTNSEPTQGLESTSEKMCANETTEENIGEGTQELVISDSSSAEESFSSESSSADDIRSSSSSSEDQKTSSASSSESECNNSSDNERADSDSDSDGTVVSPPVYDGCSLTVDEGVLELMNLYLKHKMEKTALGSTLKSTLKFLPKFNSMPKSQHSLLKYVSDLCPLSKEKVHFYCSICQYYLGEKEICCPLCSGESKKFYQLSLEDQIKNLFENHGLADDIDKYAAEREAAGVDDGTYSDLCDGNVIKNVKTPGRYNLTLVGHTDGLSISKSSNISAWPLEFVIAEVPPHLRYKYVLVCGIWIDEAKPNLNSYLRPFVTEISLINKNGVNWVHPKTKIEQSTTVTVPLFIADAPARAQLQNILSHGGKNCCNVCEAKMKKLPREPLQLGVKRKSRRRVFTFEEVEVLRTAERMKDQGTASRRLQELNGGELKAVKGVKGASVLSSLPGCDRSTVVFPEYMHVLLCLIKHFLTIFFTKSGPWNLSDKQDIINEFLKNICVPDFITRTPRSTEYYGKWKANEFRSFLLYYSVIILSKCMKEEYFQHWILLVMAIYLLLQETVSDVDIERATIMLQIFCRDFSKLYKADFYTYYVHNILHLPLAVKRNGPLWCHSAFQFESFNGTLVKFIHGSHHQAQELVNNIRLAFGVAVLEGRVKNNDMNSLKTGTIEFKNRVRKCSFTDAELALFSSEFGEACKIKVFYRLKMGYNDVYTCSIYRRQKKRNNYTICYYNKTTQREEYGEIKYFCEVGKSAIALVKQFDLDHLRCFTHIDSGIVLKHIIPITSTDKIHIIHLTEIRHKVIKVCDYLCLRPNKYEVNL